MSVTLESFNSECNSPTHFLLPVKTIHPVGTSALQIALVDSTNQTFKVRHFGISSCFRFRDLIGEGSRKFS
jgi:hypothetical protein